MGSKSHTIFGHRCDMIKMKEYAVVNAFQCCALKQAS